MPLFKVSMYHHEIRHRNMECQVYPHAMVAMKEQQKKKNIYPGLVKFNKKRLKKAIEMVDLPTNSMVMFHINHHFPWFSYGFPINSMVIYPSFFVNIYPEGMNFGQLRTWLSHQHRLPQCYSWRAWHKKALNCVTVQLWFYVILVQLWF